MIGTVGTKLGSLAQVLSRLESSLESGFYPGGKRTTGSHSVLFYFSVWNAGNLHRFTHAYPFTFIVCFPLSFFSFSFPFSFLVHVRKKELEGPEGDWSLRNLCSHGGLLGEGAGEER